MSMIDYYGGMSLGGYPMGGNAWIDFLKANKGNYTQAQLREMYNKQKVKKPRAKKEKQLLLEYHPEGMPAKKPRAPRKPRAKKGDTETLKAIIANAKYLDERLHPQPRSKDAKVKKVMKHLKDLGFNTKAMTKAQKVKLSKYLHSRLEGHGVGQDVGALVDNIFGFGGEALGGASGLERMASDMIQHMMGLGVGEQVGSIVDDIFGFGGEALGGARHPRHPRARHPRVRHARGGFSLADLAPLAMLAL